MKLSNRNKDKFIITVVMIVFMWILVLLMVGISKLFAQNIQLSDVEQYNKYMSEERIKGEMYYMQCWQIIEDMSEEEYSETFLRS